MPAPEIVKKLVDNFHTHLDHYKSSGYNETEVRREYLDPFWKALGWDIDNEQGHADAYKDVIHEDAIKIGGYTKAPDYCFRIGGTRKFFLEAKKPSVDLKSDIAPAYQLRRYAWSAKLPLSVLSDFEELAIYDCRVKPNKTDKASHARTLYFTYDQYEDKWDEIADIFSRAAVLRGSFDKYAESSRKKKGTAEVDDAFLAEIERWRDAIARNLALRNPTLTVRDLNFAVQKTIDRLIFLRICEDRGTEDYGRLKILQNGTGTYARLLEQFRKADDRYNSGLFHFSVEKDRPGAADTLTPGLTLDDKVLKDIVKNLYYPDSPYEFSVLPADILGQVYEQFLGKTIRLTSTHQAKIEEKPEVRKAGGVFYTPKYIVDYIVENTLGRQLNGSDPANPSPITVSKAEDIKVLDPACGSGSFLIVAYQYLLDWHRDQYTLDPATKEPDSGKIARHSKGKTPKIYQAGGGIYRLTTAERKRILLNNIHGVDIDSQAVEVTKLSLLLKVLEGETSQNLQQDFLAERQRILPDLGHNIQCGNSLIGPDFYDQPDLPALDDETRFRINVFDWHAAFPHVFQQGVNSRNRGFDCIIGNPPYIRIQSLRDVAREEADAYGIKYASASEGNFDIYVCFIEKALDLLARTGTFGYILPHKFFNAAYGNPVRKLLSEGRHTRHVVSFGAEQVFKDATTYTCIYIGSKEINTTVEFQRAYDLDAWRQHGEPSFVKAASATFGTDPWHLISEKEHAFLDRLSKNSVFLNSVCNSITQGLKTGADKVFVLNMVRTDGDSAVCYSKYLEKEVSVERDILLPLAKGGDMSSFKTPSPARVILFPYTTSGNLLTSEAIRKKYPKAWQYLLESRRALDTREKGKFAGTEFYQYSRVQCISQSRAAKILTPDLAPSPRFSVDDDGQCAYLGGAAGGYGLIINKEWNKRYILGCVNSKLMLYFIKLTSTVFRGGWNSYEKRFIGKFPIRPIDVNNAEDVAKHDKMVTLVERMLSLHQRKATEQNPESHRHIDTDITATDRAIDRLVYQLYNLSNEEIALVEGSAD